MPLSILLSEPPDGTAICVLSECISLAEGAHESWETITRVVTFDDDYYGTVDINRRTLQQMIANFQANVYGQDIAIDVAHMPSDGAAGFIRELNLDRGRLRGRIEWTAFGLDAVRRRGFRYFSAEYVDDYKDPETGKKHGPLLMGAGLTTRPRVKRLDPVALSFDTQHPLAVAPRMRQLLSDEVQLTMNKFLEKLRAIYAAKKLSGTVVTNLLQGFETAAVALGDDEPALQKLFAQFEGLAVQLSEQSAQHVTVQLGDTDAITEQRLHSLLDERERLADQARQQRADQLKARVKRFQDQLDAVDSFSDDTRRLLSESSTLITADFSDAQVDQLAQQQLRLGEQLEASRQLSSMGYATSPAGQVHVQLGEDLSVKKLQDTIDEQLKRSNAFRLGQIKASAAEKLSPFTAKVLSLFDAQHGQLLHLEAKRFSDGKTRISDTELPASFKRTVLREIFSDLNVLDLVKADVDANATMTTTINYMARDTSAVRNGGIVYEGQGIYPAGVRQFSEPAYLLPTKLSLRVSNEVIHFSRASQINWDAYAENVASNAQVMRELLAARIANEWQRTADAFGAVNVTGETQTAQINGSANRIYTANFPIVRPHQQRDMKGDLVGSIEQPITVVLGGVTLAEYDGSGTQAAGTYYRVSNYNIGHIEFVNQAGVPVAPTNGTTCLVSYSYATNCARFDLDVPGGVEKKKHLNGLLELVGARKASQKTNHYVMPNFLLMASTLNDTCSNAEQFVASQQRAGSGLDGVGDLQVVKGISSYGTDAPGIDIGEERILMGIRGSLAYTIAKPFVTGQPFEAFNDQGLPTAEKMAYGEEYSSVYVPTKLRKHATSVIVYSATGRVA